MIYAALLNFEFAFDNVTKEESANILKSPVKSKIRSKRLMISDIPFATSMKELKDIFKEKIGICGRLEFIDRDGKFTGNATMEFKTLDGAQKAVEQMHKYSINGREIIVREETSKDRERLNTAPQSRVIHQMGSINPEIIQLVQELERDVSQSVKQNL